MQFLQDPEVQAALQAVDADKKLLTEAEQSLKQVEEAAEQARKHRDLMRRHLDLDVEALQLVIVKVTKEIGK